MKESEFEQRFLKMFDSEHPLIFKGDAVQIQGFPDRILIFPNSVAVFLEFKKCRDAHHQKNQDFYIDLLREYGYYANFVYPENALEVFHDIIDVLASRT